MSGQAQTIVSLVCLHHTDSVLYREEILQLFAPQTIASVVSNPIGLSSIDNSLYSSIHTNELYKRSTSDTVAHPSYDPSSSLAYNSFISSTLSTNFHHRGKRSSGHWTQQKAFKASLPVKVRRMPTITSVPVLFKKSSAHESADPEEDYVSWSMVKHHRAVPMSQIREWKAIKKPSRPIKLSSFELKTNKVQMPRTESHFETFTLVKHDRSRGIHQWLLSNQIGLPLDNHTHFLDDDDEGVEEGAGNSSVKSQQDSKLRESPGLDITRSSRKPFGGIGMGHESWPTFTEDFGSDAQELRVEPYVWSVILSECSKACGQGIRTVRVVCTVGQKTVDEKFCDQVLKPSHKSIEPCKERECIGRQVS